MPMENHGVTETVRTAKPVSHRSLGRRATIASVSLGVVLSPAAPTIGDTSSGMAWSTVSIAADWPW